MADSERKLKELSKIVVKESKKKWLILNCKKIECMVISRRERRNKSKYDTEIWRHIGISKVASQKLSKVLRD